jgi:hypothetical protein
VFAPKLGPPGTGVLIEVFAVNPIVKASLIGMGMGAALGIVPGLFSAIVGHFVPLLRADIGISNTSSVLIYLGILIGGAAGSIVGALAATEEAEEADVEPVKPGK